MSTCARPAIAAATASTSGAAIRHGPHQPAQKSTSTGTLACCKMGWRLPVFASIGSATGPRGFLQEPQRPTSAKWAAGMRFLVRHDLHCVTMENIFSILEILSAVRSDGCSRMAINPINIVDRWGLLAACSPLAENGTLEVRDVEIKRRGARRPQYRGNLRMG